MINPYFLKIRLFTLKGGCELTNTDTMGSVSEQEYIFYSLGEDFDHGARMEFIHKKAKLGEGGFGSVFLADDDITKDEVAIKVLNFSSSSNSHMITKEIEALGQLRHRGIVKLHDYFPLPKKQQLIVVMEYLKGKELNDLWRAQPHRQFRESHVYALMMQMLNAVQYCHTRKVIHRDLKF